MNLPDRLLIITSSRYDGLIMRRELADKFPETVITTMNSAATGLAELTNNIYHTTVLELNCLASTDQTRLIAFKKTLLECSAMRLILLKSLPESLAQNALVQQFENQLTSERLATLTKESSYERLLPGLINKVSNLQVDCVPAGPAYRVVPERSSWLDSTDLAGQLAHEINNPLMMITGTAELILQGSADISDDVGKKLKIIKRAAGRIRVALTRLKEQQSW